MDTNPCSSCGQEIDDEPGARCDACEHRARTELGEFVILLDGRPVCPTKPDDPKDPAYVFTTVALAERMATICYPGLSSRIRIEPKDPHTS